MADNALFRELCKAETLRIGWHLAHVDSRDNFVVDPVSYEDVATHLSERLQYLIREIRHERYRPGHLIEIDLPKSGLGIRPGNVLPIDEAVLLHAIVFLLAPRLDRRLSDSVFSYRLRKDWEKRVKKGKSMFRDADDEIPFLRRVTVRKIDPLEPWYTAWPEFDRQRIDAFKKHGYTHLTRTDIAAYFENIDLQLLGAQLRQVLPKEPIIVSLLMRVLESWTRLTPAGIPVGRGIPQGNDVSSFLGNIYLLPLDNALIRFASRTDADWLRYVDDVEVYTKDPTDARTVVLVINEALRRLHLNIQGSKTDILSGRDLDRELSRSESEALDAAWKKLEKLRVDDSKHQKRVTAVLNNLRPVVRRFRSGLPESVYGLQQKDSRVLRRSLTIWGHTGRPYLKKTALALLKEPPEYRLLLKSLRYLEQLPYSLHDSIVDDLLEVLEGSAPLLPFHRAAMLGALRKLHPSEAKLNVTRRITRIAFRAKAEWPVRQQALQLLAVLPAREATALKRATNSLEHHHPFVRRAALVMLTRASVQDVRTQTTRLMYDPDPAVSRLAGLWFRHINDKAFAEAELRRLQMVSAADQQFLWRIPKLWVLRCCKELAVIKDLRGLLCRFEGSKSAKVRHHVSRLRHHTAWAEDA
ncbi:MAG: reverse transcriptase domain-containing protein [Planctomycetota bacterium]|jgi:hypothetical protein